MRGFPLPLPSGERVGVRGFPLPLSSRERVGVRGSPRHNTRDKSEGDGDEEGSVVGPAHGGEGSKPPEHLRRNEGDEYRGAEERAGGNPPGGG